MKHNPTLEQLLRWCGDTQSSIALHPDGTIYTATGEDVGLQRTVEQLGRLFGPCGDPAAPLPGVLLHAPGYESLGEVLARAFDQAARGKGHERHAQGEPFDAQVMADTGRRFGVGALLGQAFKKSEESQRLPYPRAVAELLGAINYLAGAVIQLDRVHRTAANDNSALAAQGETR